MALVLRVELLQQRHGLRLLGQDALGGHLSDVGRSEIDAIREAVLHRSESDLLRVDGRNHFLQLLLGRDHDPNGRNDLVGLGKALADLAELLHGRPQVFDLVAAAGDVLPHFVDDENQRLAGTAAAGKLEGPFDDLLHGDGGVAVPLRMRPRIRRRIRCRVQGMENGTGTGDLLRPLAHHLPVQVVQLLAGGDEFVQPALGLQLDFQLRDVEVLGIVQFAEQHRVH